MFVRALRVLIDLNGPDHPHLGPPPTSALEPRSPISAQPGVSTLGLSYSVGVPVVASWVDFGLAL